MISVAPGETFDLNVWVEGFTGTLSSSDILLGFNILDGDNGLFLDETISDVSHVVDGNGDSAEVYTPTFTAPMEEGMYTLKSYGVTGDVDYFHYIGGDVIVVVTGAVAPLGYLDDIVE